MSFSKNGTAEKRKKVKYFVIVLSMLLIASLLVALFSYFKKNNYNKVNNKSTKAVFERNNNIYTYNVYDDEVTVIGDEEEKKELMALSPDFKNIAYKRYYEDAASNPVEVKVYDVNKKQTYEVLKDEQSKNVTDLKWIDNESLMVTSKVNPSSMDYDIYNVKTQKKEKSIKGIILQFLGEKDILYNSYVEGNSNLFINDKKVYEIDNNGEEIISASISKDKSKISFITSKYNADDMVMDQCIYSGTYDDENKIIQNVKKNEIPPEVYGDITYDDKNNIIISNGEVSYKVEGSFFSKVEPIEKESDLKPSEEELIKFKTALKKAFPKEFIEDYLEMDELQIYNIKWYK